MTATKQAPNGANDPVSAATGWLDRFNSALTSGNVEAVGELFVEHSHWRDVLAFQWDYRTIKGREAISRRLVKETPTVQPGELRLAKGHTAPINAMRVGRASVEAIVEFETAVGSAKGVVRLVSAPSDPSDGRALAFMTALQTIHGHEPRLGDNRIERVPEDQPGESWLDKLARERCFEGKDPEVLVVGAGHSGLFIATRLQDLGVETLVIDKLPRIGDNWRNRYRSLVLHNELCANGFPHLPYPENWPVYLPKDKYAGWLEAFAEFMELRVWTATTFLGGAFDEASGRWDARIRGADGRERTLHPRHVVLATGGFAPRKLYPKLEGIEYFRGLAVHAADFKSSPDLPGKKAIVIGTGTSGHDLSRELVDLGCKVTMVQRGSTQVISLTQANLAYALYHEKRSTEESDLIGLTNDFESVVKSCQEYTKLTNELDKELIRGLHAVGFRTDDGPSGGGYLLSVYERRGGYYIDVGASQYLIDGRIQLVRAEAIAKYGPDGAELKDGGRIEADIIVFATGYHGSEVEIEKYFGAEVARKVGQIWGYGEDGEIRNAWRPTSQRGLWLQLGAISASRNHSKYLALGIKAELLGLARRKR
ncbi:flavin-containing monooxygenase [Bradyrhizobium retamae]|uniref:Monooxygenase n=1 Tax=Bradyrhizobium retamae TaxID=1300035 RepID=A0A0R3MCN9_9BRAD|nr:NAD(P)/FAD-dependent oxidoreductase [Bradyrhizobium retamae]KRR17643.1 hypothetical protein CQ13_36100 [Bradyrhizobium retamae]